MVGEVVAICGDIACHGQSSVASVKLEIQGMSFYIIQLFLKD